jgi:hypothetical protein
MSGSNADTIPISLKEEISIALSLTDLEAIGYSDKLQSNYSATELVVTIPTEDYINSSSYYTPLYKEKLDYNTWLSRINKNFQELD